MKKAKKMTKTSAVIAEYNPLHNGHKYNLDKIKELSDCQNLAVIMSGNFTQRGDIALADKYTRATHAIKAGADIVIELPTVFATANAEIFALGGAKIFSEINASTLCFGAENASVEDFLTTAKLTLNESKEFKKRLKEHLKSGYRFAKAKSMAFCEVSGVKEEMLSSPNNILGVEYVKALLKLCPESQILPIARVGSAFNDNTLRDNFSSASAIRFAIKNGGDFSSNLPPFVIQDLPKNLPNLDKVLLYSILQKSPKQLSQIADCSEGLENRIFRLARESSTTSELLEKLSCKRYTLTRLQRLLVSCLLDIDKNLTKLAKKTQPYIKVLAIKKEKMSLLSEISKTVPLITRKKDEEKLNKKQKLLFEKDVFAGEIYSLITNTKQNPFEMKIV